MSKGKLIEVEFTSKKEVNKLIHSMKKEMRILGELLKKLSKIRDEK